ncbi:hypothetical protein D5F01_LYC24521 [Larimichthys crocea]|uniref:Uncharacterized protein n=1 Tax=Larimichthys crocea TaxID=215358 RepID=A0A6G0HEW1_LARCR|nr:hypothetical protein D5F01_LYC24521 [Larimichthys crocea]
MVDNIILSRSDFWSLGLDRDIDGMILNCCLKVIAKRVQHVFAGDSYVIATFPSTSVNPMDHLPDNATSLQWILLPVFVPGHWILCEDALLRDTIEAAKWCTTQPFKGKLSLPQVISMDQKGRLKAVERLRISEGLDEEENEGVRESFLFLFSLQEDHEAFCTEIMDTRHLQAFSFEV